MDITIDTVDQPQLSADLDALATRSATAPPTITRVLFSPADQQARELVRALCQAAGLTIREDPLGNLFARWQGTDPALKPVASGSHIDAIPDSGMYDGTVGVLGAIAAVRALRQAGFVPRRSLELIMFTSEEPTRFGVGCLGSRALCGQLGRVQLQGLRDQEGRELDALRDAAGFSGDLAAVQLPVGHYHAFVELHIEQGPILEREQIALGAVRAIAAPAALRLVLSGVGGHAGATLMPGRRDALLAAAEIALAVEQAALATGSPDTVATTGLFQIEPGAVNSIPSRAVLEIDVRDVAPEPRDAALQAIDAAITAICARRQVGVERTLLNADPPAACDPALVRLTEQVAGELGLTSRVMVSRAYHDSLFMARICPTTMIFIPCRNGWSHRPDEYVEPAALAHGVAALARVFTHLCG